MGNQQSMQDSIYKQNFSKKIVDQKPIEKSQYKDVPLQEKELEKSYKSSLITERSELIAVEMLVDGITPESYSLNAGKEMG